MVATDLVLVYASSTKSVDHRVCAPRTKSVATTESVLLELSLLLPQSLCF